MPANPSSWSRSPASAAVSAFVFAFDSSGVTCLFATVSQLAATSTILRCARRQIVASSDFCASGSRRLLVDDAAGRIVSMRSHVTTTSSSSADASLPGGQCRRRTNGVYRLHLKGKGRCAPARAGSRYFPDTSRRRWSGSRRRSAAGAIPEPIAPCHTRATCSEFRGAPNCR